MTEQLDGTFWVKIGIATLIGGWMQVTKVLKHESYPETDGPVVNATEVDGVLETEGTVAAAGIALDRYAAFRACMKGPGVTTDRKSDCWPSAVEDGYVYWVCRSLSPVCLYWDADGDGDVDLRDFARLQRWNGLPPLNIALTEKEDE